MKEMFTVSHGIAHVRPTTDNSIDESRGDEEPRKSHADKTPRDSDAVTGEVTPAPPARSPPARSPATPRRALVGKVSKFALRRRSPSDAQEATPVARVSMDGASPTRITPIQLRGYLEEMESDDSKADKNDSTYEVNSAQGEIEGDNAGVKQLDDGVQGVDFSANVNMLLGSRRDSRSTQTKIASPMTEGNGCRSPASAASQTGIFDDTDDSREISDTRSATHGKMLKNRTRKNRVAPVNPRQRSSDTCSTASEISTITTTASGSISRTTKAKVPKEGYGNSGQLDDDKLRNNRKDEMMKGETRIGGVVDGYVGLENSSGGVLYPMKHASDRKKMGPVRCACALM